MNGHMSRGCPPSPIHIPVHTDPSRPPPPPREMYASGNRDSQFCKGPPLPKRNPETRVSSSCIPNAVHSGFPCSPTVRDSHATAHTDRSPSPPLPPPPPELLEDYLPQPVLSYVPQNIPVAQCSQHLPFTSATTGTSVVQQPIRQLQRPMPHPGVPPPLPPVSSIPKIKTEDEIPSTRLNIPQMGVDFNDPAMGSNLNVPYTSPSSSSRDGSQVAAGLPQEVSKVQLKKTDNTSTNSSMDINIDDIDLSDVPGYTPITKSTPVWKKEMIEKKNQEKIQEYIIKKKKEKEEADKWKNVPAWKRKLMLEKEKEKEKLTEDEQRKNAEEEANRKKMTKQAEEERKAKIKEQQEMEKRMQEELQDVPEWKREIMMKRGGAIKNWKDEREDVNDQEPQNVDRISGETQQIDGTPEKKSSMPSTPRRSLEEAKIEEEWESLPLWKREIMMKRGGAIRNWADEREELNEQFGEQ